MSTIKDKMVEALAIYVAQVRDGRDAMVSDEDVAANAFDIMAGAAYEHLDPEDFRTLTDIVFITVVEEPEPVAARPMAGADVSAAREALLALAQALGVSL